MFLQLTDFQGHLVCEESPGCGAALFFCHSLKDRKNKFALKERNRYCKSLEMNDDLSSAFKDANQILCLVFPC